MLIYIGIIVFRLIKQIDEFDIKAPTLLGGQNTFTGGARSPVPPPPRWLRPCVQ